MDLQITQKGEKLIPDVITTNFNIWDVMRGGFSTPGSTRAGGPLHYERRKEPLSDNSERIAIVDASNIAYVRGTPSLDNVRKVDEYLQSRGFLRENIVFVFDASFRYKVDKEEFEEFVFNDERVSVSPAREQADTHILEYAYENMTIEEERMPFIISNDQYADHFRKYPALSCLKEFRRGITWINCQGENRPVLSIDC